MKSQVVPVVLGDYLAPIQFGYEPLPKKRKLPNLTGEYLKVLQRPLKPGLIEFISTVIIGTMGYGKTELAKWVAVKVSKFYGAEKVNAIMNRSADLNVLLEAMDDRPVQLLFLDDSYGEMPKDIAKQFTRIRHRFHEVLTEAGKPESGVIIALFGIQDIFTLDKLARRVSTATIAKSSSGDKWYKDNLKQIFGQEGTRELDRITRRVTRNYDQAVKGRGIIALTGFDKPGLIKSELVGEDLYTEILSPVEDEEEAPQAQRLQKVRVEELEDGKLRFELVDTIEDPGFLQLIYDRIPDALKVVKTHKYKPKHAEVWKAYYIDGATWDNLAEQWGFKTTSTFLNPYRSGGWMAILSEEVLGYAAELALQERYYPDCVVVGGNTPGQPDLLNEATGLMVEVKVRKRLESASTDMLSESELQNVKEGKPVQVAIITYKAEATKKGRETRCSIHVWQPLFNPTPLPDPAPSSAAGEGDPPTATSAPEETEEARLQPQAKPQEEPEERPREGGVEQERGSKEGGVETCEAWPDPVLLEPVAYFKAMEASSSGASRPSPPAP